ncbi:MAG: heat-inducible transcriptional repressor HrcA [Candidatus Tantalella remota]|nr:heat-inducible transcriptional repressor HrcA [Candidatus Tantalella remota]
MTITGNQIKKEQRKYRVLEHIVHEYISSAVPVSSRVVSVKMGGRVSSATVRNIMAELEEKGYIEQPHTSAGRVPTQLGYRHYVNMINDHLRFEQKEARRLASEYARRINTIKEVLSKTSFLISRELHNAGMVLLPSTADFYLKHIELVKVRAETVMAVLVTMTNDVRNYLIKLDHEMQRSGLEKVVNYINNRYEGTGVSAICDDLRRTLNDEDVGEGEDILEAARTSLKVIDTVIDENIENELYWEGLNYVMDEMRSEDMDAARRILSIFSDKKDITRLMREELPYRGMKIYIGKENSSTMLRDCSVVTCGYTLHGRTVGRIGVIGPTRMDYNNAISTLNCLSGLIGVKLEEIND